MFGLTFLLAVDVHENALTAQDTSVSGIHLSSADSSSVTLGPARKHAKLFRGVVYRQKKFFRRYTTPPAVPKKFLVAVWLRGQIVLKPRVMLRATYVLRFSGSGDGSCRMLYSRPGSRDLATQRELHNKCFHCPV